MGLYVTREDIAAYALVVPEMIEKGVSQAGLEIDPDQIDQSAQAILKLLVPGSRWTDQLEMILMIRTIETIDQLTGRSLH